MKIKIITMCIFMACVFSAHRAVSCDIDFNSDSIPIPYPPQISDVSNSPALSGSFKVTASIVGRMQMSWAYYLPLDEHCQPVYSYPEFNEHSYMAPDSLVVPNPPSIQKATVYYYKNDNVTGAASVDMAYDAELGKFKADVPLAGFVQGDTVTYYIVAVDSRGNVASQVPDVNQRPCPSTSSWDASLSTPATNSCSYATSYAQCNEYAAGTPGPCSSSYTMGDKNGDVCGEPGIGGCGDAQCVITGAQADMMDIIGISAGADGTYVCANMGLKAPIPPNCDHAPIESYITIFINPDIYDPDPGDMHITNAYAITYAPKAVGSDPTLVKVLWSGDCLTDPNTSNPLDCKLISAVGASEDLKIEYGGGSLKYMVKKSGTGNPLAEPFNIIGGNTKQTIIMGLTGEINLSGGTAFWISDITPGFALYHTNKTVNVTEYCDVTGPIIKNTRCSVDGVGGTGNVCGKSASRPERNVCKINFYKSLDYSFTDSYNVYRNTTGGITGAVKIGSVDETGQQTYGFEDTHTVLDGKTYTYFITSYNTETGKESKLYDASKSQCTVEDWNGPDKPEITSAATPPRNEKKCEIKWRMPAADASLSHFYISRSDDGGASYTPLNYTNPMGADPNSLTASWTDPAVLELNRTYKYKVAAVDIGNNVNESAPFDCAPEDFKAPGQINSILVMNNSGNLGVKMDWQPSMDNDLSGYNINWCRLNNKAIDCRTAASFSKINSSPISTNYYQAANDTYPTIFAEEGEYCFYVETCDNCAASGTCPSNGGAPNCSGFPSGGADSTLYVKCLYIGLIIDCDPPAFPQNPVCNILDDGKKVKLSWDPVCHNSYGRAFESYDAKTGTCSYTNGYEFAGYKVIFGADMSILLPENTSPQNTAGVVADGLNTELIHSGLTNGQEYCYIVYGLDHCGGFSMENAQFPSTVICCTPRDTKPPGKPAMGDIDYTSISCTPSWSRVGDDETYDYNLYRCEGTAAACADGNDYTSIAANIIEEWGLSYADYDVITDHEYQYCVTAKDTSGNESAVIDATEKINCGVCIPTDRPAPAAAVTAAPLTLERNTGVKIFWSRSASDDGGGGYNVYRCNNSACANRGGAIRACLKTVPTAAAPLVIDGEPAGDWYYGVTYMKDCGDDVTESLVNTTADGSIYGPINVPSPEPTPCSQCIVISSCSDYEEGTGCVPVRAVDTSTKNPPPPDGDGKFAVSGVAGFQVFLADGENNIIGEAATTDGNGNYKLIVANDSREVNVSDKYKIVLKVPEAEMSGVPCSPGFLGNDCYVVLDGAVRFSDDGTVKKISGLNLPAPGGGRAEIGNPDCNNSIDVGDLLVLRDAFGSNLGDGKYKTYADFDGNGSVDVEDFLIFKRNFGKTLDAAPTFDATLCKP